MHDSPPWALGSHACTCAGPAIIRSGILMPTKQILVPDQNIRISDLVTVEPGPLHRVTDMWATKTPEEILADISALMASLLHCPEDRLRGFTAELGRVTKEQRLEEELQ